MKKYIFVLLVLAIACAFSLSAVASADLEKYDFDGEFTLEMDKGLNFTKSTYYNPGFVTFSDYDHNCSVMYCADSVLNESYADDYYNNLSSAGYEKVSSDGDIQIFKDNTTGYYAAFDYKDGIVVVVSTLDQNKSLEYMKTIKYK